MPSQEHEKAKSVLGKRSRAWEPSELKDASEILASQIDLEIALRKRIAEAANAKIAWAQAMHSAVFKGSQVSAYGAKDHTSTAFQRESLDTLHAISRLAPTLEPKHTLLPGIGLAHEEEQKSEAIVIERPADIIPVASPSPVEPESPSPIVISGKPLFIYQQTAPGAPFITLLIACETCGRSNFLTVHSVLNHTRISHGVSYRNHEECIERCGQVVTGPEALRIRREGTMATGQTLPGMRKLLELAIRHGGDMDSNLLYQSLGLHADSPALAAYLGKTVQRKQIRVFEPVGDIDVVTVHEEDRINPVIRRRRWRPPSANHVIDSDDDSAPPLESEKALLFNLSLLKRDSTLSVTESEVPASRFHIKRRIIITDWSQQISQLHHTRAGIHLSHKWMVSITSPSYSNHVTTFLSRLSISSGSDPPPPCFISSRVLSTDSPPYSIIGTTNRPFLARIKLEWIGGPTKSLEIEHWVRLTPLKGVQPRIGEEQILDVELDRGTPFRPEIITPQLSWAIPVQDIPHPSPVVKLENHPIAPLEGPYDLDLTGTIQPFESVLRSLMQGIPFTLEDTIGRDITLTETDLPKSRDVFLSFVDGRRKAYEFRYARTLQESFQYMALGDPSLSQVPTALRAVTPGVLYRWLSDQDFFPRPEPAPLDVTKQFCSFCGLEAMEHPSPLKLEDKDQESIPNVCPEADTLASFGHMPAVDVHAWLASIMAAHVPLASRPSSISNHLPLWPSTHELVQSTDPRLVHFIHDAVVGLRLPCFRSPYTPGTRGHIFPLDQLGETSDEVEKAIAPYSLLSRILCLVVRDLVQGGISAARATAAHVRSKAYMQRTSPLGYHYPAPPRYHYPPMNTEEHSAYLGSSRQVLTRSHIVRGLESGSMDMARLRMAVSRLTVGKTGFALGGVGASVRENNNENEGRVKEEPDWE